MARHYEKSYREKKHRLTTEEQRQVRILRDGDPVRFTIRKLAEKFNVPRYQIDQLFTETPRTSRKRSSKPEGKRATILPLKRFLPDPRDVTGQFFNDPLPHHVEARERRKHESDRSSEPD